MISLLSILATITLSVTPSVCQEPCTLTATLQVEKATDNEKVVITLEAEDSEYFRSSDLDYSLNTPRTIQIRYISVPAGNYILKAVLYKHGGVKSRIGGMVVRSVRIVGDEDQD